MSAATFTIDRTGRASTRTPGRGPFGTRHVWLLALAAVFVFYNPALRTLLQFDRAAIARGEWWRLITCHWTHWSVDHLAWDVSVFGGLAAACVGQCRRRLVWVLAGASIAVSAAVWFAEPGLMTYRGLSGIDAALLALLATDTALASRDNGVVRFICGVLLLTFLAKVGFEWTTGRTFFVDSRASGFIPVPLAHVVGAAVGVMAALPFRRRRFP